MSTEQEKIIYIFNRPLVMFLLNSALLEVRDKINKEAEAKKYLEIFHSLLSNDKKINLILRHLIEYYLTKLLEAVKENKDILEIASKIENTNYTLTDLVSMFNEVYKSSEKVGLLFDITYTVIYSHVCSEDTALIDSLLAIEVLSGGDIVNSLLLILPDESYKDLILPGVLQGGSREDFYAEITKCLTARHEILKDRYGYREILD